MQRHRAVGVRRTAQAWVELPEVQTFVEKCRVGHAERMVGKAACLVERAMDRLVELSECVSNPRLALSACKVIIKNWIDLSVHFVQERQYQWLIKRVKELKDARAAQKRAMKHGGWAY